MDLEQRVAELERRLAALERSAGLAAGPPERESDDDLWALHGLQAQLAELGAHNGGVLFTGAVRIPAGQRYEWQYGLDTDTVLDADWADAAESFAALGQPVRLRLLREILRGRCTAAELTELDGTGTTGQIYHHLRQLTAAGWLHTAARGRYEVPAHRVVPLLVMLTAAGR
ncbi:helix-turn-helix domain-containing protein [Streptomyces decoyicus]|uniref:helix-turn-helix domain-containing protein n=1 Tax=Streptomyces decoyicus TaxID=249567 RepID=UPI0004AAF611|nr:helix-turn-helix domain-containing protein [Streptomyces decoyicus]KOG37991.1 ArsR family transcriptional regulator [Streptomyces decoyicus]QZY16850.1 helix-turn-helix domain-containing protein [Streptomyces decoyicus]